MKTTSMRKAIFWILLLIILLALYATNPSKSDFKEYAGNVISSEIKEKGVTSNNFIDGLIGTLLGKATETAVDVIFTQKNYYLFSIFEVEGTDFSYKYLGIFRVFIPIEDFIDVSKINLNFQDWRAVVDEDITVEEDYYTYFNITLDSPAEVKISTKLLSGPEVEMFYIKQEDFPLWEGLFNGNGQSSGPSYYTELSQSGGIEIEKEAALDQGDYCLIIENSNAGEIAPPFNFQNDVSQINVKVTLKDL